MSSRSRDVFVGSALSSVEVEFSAVCRPIIFPRADKSVVDDEENAPHTESESSFQSILWLNIYGSKVQGLT